MNRLEVQSSKFQSAVLILLGLFFVPLGLLSIATGLLKGLSVVPLGIGLMMLVCFGVIFAIIRRAYKRSVKYFADEGIMLNNGRSYAWADLSRVVNQIRVHPATNKKMLWRTEIHFKNGESAWLLPTKISNFGEVSAFVHSLPCEHAEVNV